MANILILGAGAIGTAFSIPCSDKNNSVAIIGTHLESNFIDQINSKRIHPALKCHVPKNVQFLKFNKLSETINKKVDLIVVDTAHGHSKKVGEIIKKISNLTKSDNVSTFLCNIFYISFHYHKDKVHFYQSSFQPL